jgi:hypothetical protein
MNPVADKYENELIAEGILSPEKAKQTRKAIMD